MELLAHLNSEEFVKGVVLLQLCLSGEERYRLGREGQGTGEEGLALQAGDLKSISRIM